MRLFLIIFYVLLIGCRVKVHDSSVALLKLATTAALNSKGTKTVVVVKPELSVLNIPETMNENETVEAKFSFSSTSITDPTTVTVTSDSPALTMNGSSSVTLNFTPSNALTPQSVTVKAEADVDLVAETVNLKISATNFSLISKTVTINDTDVQSIVTDSSSLRIPNSSSLPLAVSLAKQDQSDVTLSLLSSSPSKLSISLSSLTFTKSNYNVSQSVTLTCTDSVPAKYTVTLSGGSLSKTVPVICAPSAGGNLVGLFTTGQTSTLTTGDDGYYKKTATRAYTDNGDGTVTEDVSGLVWQKCSAGLNNDSTCSGTATNPMDWTNAVSYCSSLTLAGRTWRLPELKELHEILDFSLAGNSVNLSVFPNNKAYNYWTNTVVASSPTNAWDIAMNLGYITPLIKIGATMTHTRCVSGPPPLADSWTDNGDGTVTDNRTNLIWQKCSRGQNNDATCTGTATTSNWLTAVTYCNSLVLASRAWRLPNLNELFSTSDQTRASAPMINVTNFPSTQSNNYWSSTSYSTNSSFHWRLNYSDGTTNYAANTSSFYARCVTGP